MFPGRDEVASQPDDSARQVSAEVIRLQHDIGDQRLVLAVRFVFGGVEQLALLLVHVLEVPRRAGNEDVVGDDDGPRVQPAAVQDALQVELDRRSCRGR